jgi:Glycosyltransferase
MASPLPVAFVHDTNVYGGVELHVLMLLRYLDTRRYTPAVVVPGYTDIHRSSPQRFIDETAALGVPILRPPHPGDQAVVSFLRDVSNLRRLFREHGTRVVHVHTCRPEGARKAIIAARLAGVPAVLRSEHVPPSLEMKRHTRTIIKPIDRMTDYVVVGSEVCREEQIRLLARDPKKVHLAYYGIELDRFNPEHDVRAAKIKAGLDPDLPVVGAIGRLAEMKGHTYLIDAAARIVKEYGPVQFLIVGDGPLNQPLKEQVARLGLEKYFHFAGFQANTIPFMEATDIATMPSALNEGISLAMLEYMAMGKPMVSSDELSFKETVEDGVSGIIVPMRDADGLAEGILTLLRDPELAARIAQNGLNRVRDTFNIRWQAENLMSLYDRILGIDTVGASRGADAELVSGKS